MKYHLITFGCQMNKNDSERISSVLTTSGWQATNIPAEADFILLNTCSVRESAENHVFGQMKNFALLKEKNERLILGATGCMPGRDRDGKLKKKLPMIDLFFPITDLPQLPRWLLEHFPESALAEDTPEDYWRIRPKYNRNEKNEVRQAFVPISTGCNNYCTFCVVPYARGLERSRNIADVVAECRNLAEQGCL